MTSVSFQENHIYITIHDFENITLLRPYISSEISIENSIQGNVIKYTTSILKTNTVTGAKYAKFVCFIKIYSIEPTNTPIVVLGGYIYLIFYKTDTNAEKRIFIHKYDNNSGQINGFEMKSSVISMFSNYSPECKSISSDSFVCVWEEINGTNYNIKMEVFNVATLKSNNTCLACESYP